MVRARKLERCGARTQRGIPCNAPPAIDREARQPIDGRCVQHAGQVRWSRGWIEQTGEEVVLVIPGMKITTNVGA